MTKEAHYDSGLYITISYNTLIRLEIRFFNNNTITCKNTLMNICVYNTDKCFTVCRMSFRFTNTK